MNELLCLLTGGHKYSGMNLRCEIAGDEVVYKNLCLKCGKMYEVRLPKTAIFPKWFDETED